MKVLKIYIIGILFIAFGCKDGYIDEISNVDPGSDESAPEVTISNPTEDIFVFFTEENADVNFEFRASDDIELESITVSLDGEELSNYSDFTDYRNASRDFMYEDLPLGEYTLDVTATDLSGKSTTESINFEVTNEYQPKDGEVLYLPFENEGYFELVSETNATVVGTPGFSSDNVRVNYSYEGAENSYLTFPTDGLLGEEFSASFWMKINATPDRAGILVIGPPDPDKPDAMNNRTKGFRFFREAAGEEQRFKLNVGTGDADVWFDGGDAADVDPTTGDWVHFAFTISATEAAVYINGTEVSQGTHDGIDWTDCDIMSIMSGAPRFIEWGHLSDQSFMDELRIFNKALTQEEIQAIIDAES